MKGEQHVAEQAPHVRAIHVSATLPGSQIKHVVLSLILALRPLDCSAKQAVTDHPLTAGPPWGIRQHFSRVLHVLSVPHCKCWPPLPQAFSVACLSSCPWKRAHTQPLLLLGGTCTMRNLNLLFQFDPILKEFLWKMSTRKGTGVLLERNIHWAKRVIEEVASNWSEHLHQ